MKQIIILLITLFASTSMVFAQTTGDVSIGATLDKTTIPVGGTATMSTTISNAGFSSIPVGALQVSVSFPITYYQPNGSTPPTGTNASFFTWTFMAPDTWVGENNTAIGVGQSVIANFPVTGVAVTPSAQTTGFSVGATPTTSWSDINPVNNNTSISLSVTAPVASLSCTTNAIAPTTYTKNGTSQTGTYTVGVTGLTNGTSYTFTVSGSGFTGSKTIVATGTETSVVINTTYDGNSGTVGSSNAVTVTGATMGSGATTSCNTTATIIASTPTCQAGTVAPSVF